MWGSESKHSTEALPEERKALALRYIDAAGAERREQPAVEATATRAGSANRPRAAEPAVVQPGPAEPVTPARRSDPGSSLRGRLGKIRNRQEIVAESSVRCARCGQECSDEPGDWTLRLCGDDQLHAVCRDCDERDFSEVREGVPLGLRGMTE